MEMTRSSTPGSNRSVASSTRSPSTESPPAEPPNAQSTKDALILATEVEALNKTLSTVSSRAARSFARQNWRKCLVGGSVKDQSFLVRAMLKYSTPHVFGRVLEEHGESLLQAADEDFLDRALEIRLMTIGAKELVAMLSQAKRLGYDEEDVVDEEEDVLPLQENQPEATEPSPEEAPHPTEVDTTMSGMGQSDALLQRQQRNMIGVAAAPTAFYPGASAQAAIAQAAIEIAARAQAASAQAASTQPTAFHSHMPQSVDIPSRRKSNGKFVCPDCNSQFSQQGGLTYHLERRVCHRPAPVYKFFCKSCGKGFTTSGGKLYHEQNKVCDGHEKAAATSPGDGANRILVPHPQDGTHSAQYGPMPSFYQQPPPYTPQQAPPYGRPPYAQDGPHSTGHSGHQQRGPVQFADQHGYVRQKLTDLHSPVQTSVRSPSVKSSPAPELSPADIPVLDAATQAELSAKIAAEVRRFEEKCREIPDTLTATEREEEINKQKRGHATRKSQIRKKYGIQVRSSKNRAANFVRVSSKEDSPHLEPIARIGAFRATPAAKPSFSVTTPRIYEQAFSHPTPEGRDVKRRKVGSSSPRPPSRSDPYGVPGGLQRRMMESGETVDRQPHPEELEVNELGNSNGTGNTESGTTPRQVPIDAPQRQGQALQPPVLLSHASTASASALSRPGSSHSRPQSSHAARPGSSHEARPGSSHETRPGSSHGARPGSSHGARPGSSHGARPGSSHGARPGSSHGARPGSSHGARPGSSHGARPGSSHGARPGSSHGSISANSGNNNVTKPIIIGLSGSDSPTSDNDSDQDEDIPARVPSTVVRRSRLDSSRHQSISPRRVTRRVSLAMLTSPLSETGTKMRAAVPV